MAEQHAPESDDGDGDGHGDGDGALAAALIADHYAHADMALVWLAPDAHGTWHIEYANDYARRLLGVGTLLELRALELPPAEHQAPAGKRHPDHPGRTARRRRARRRS